MKQLTMKQKAHPVVSAGLLLAGLLMFAPPSQAVLMPDQQFEVGDRPRSVATGDFNGDTVLDLAAANWNSNDVSILLGNGDGAFQAAISYAVGDQPNSVATGDFNGDMVLDLAVANFNSKNVSILLGNGDGSFQTAVNYPAGTYPAYVAVGDFNGDMVLDLAVADFGSSARGNVLILLGYGDGTFQAAVNYPAGKDSNFIATGDFNGDTAVDLVVSDEGTYDVWILMGNGDGTFEPAVPYTVGRNTFSVAVDDFDNDTVLDLAVANASNKSISILLGNGDGTFQEPVDYPAGEIPNSVAVGDFNNDTRLDLAVADSDIENPAVLILLGNGDGVFQAAVSYPAGAVPEFVATGDFDGDTRLDLAVANGGSDTVSILLNQSLAPAEAIAALIEDVRHLMDTGELSRFYGGMGIYKLRFAEYAVEAGLDAWAVRSLEDFRKGVEFLVNRGQLDPEYGEDLIDKVDRIIDELEMES